MMRAKTIVRKPDIIFISTLSLLSGLLPLSGLSSAIWQSSSKLANAFTLETETQTSVELVLSEQTPTVASSHIFAGQPLNLDSDPDRAASNASGGSIEHSIGRQERRKPTSIERDSVISSSEIFADNRLLLTNPQTADTNLAANPVRQTFNCNGSQANCSKAVDDEEWILSPSVSASHYSNSRLILRLLVLGLFGLVSMSLATVYTIKFCVCNRRKILRRDLVADLNGRPAHPLYWSHCPAHSSQVSAQTSLQSLLGANLCGFGHQANASSSAPESSRQVRCVEPLISSLCCQQQQLESLYSQSTFALPPLDYASSCLPADLQQAHSSGSPEPRPPAYSDLFGASAVSNGRDEADDTPSGSQTSGAIGEQQQETQRNLLVKLNLNKTKLLSASDLVLLSKLIDVPIVVQQHQQQQV